MYSSGGDAVYASSAMDLGRFRRSGRLVVRESMPVTEDVIDVGLNSCNGGRKEIPEARGGQVLKAWKNWPRQVEPIDKMSANGGIPELLPEKSSGLINSKVASFRIFSPLRYIPGSWVADSAPKSSDHFIAIETVGIV